MLLRFILLFTLATPLIGIILVEGGEFSPSTGVSGYPNGAAIAFSAYAACALAAAWMVTRGRIFASGSRQPVEPWAIAERMQALRWAVAALAVASCLLSLFAFGGADVLAGDVGKGEFRSTLGGIGAIAYLFLKWIAPTLFGIACATHAFSRRERQSRWPLVVTGVATFVLGLSWGFKSSGAWVLLPGFVILLWHASARTVIRYAALALGTIYLAFFLFDMTEDTTYQSALNFVVARLTIFQGDVAWYAWGMLQEGQPFPDYWRTLTVAVGDRVHSALTGITRDKPEAWVLYHYGSLLTYTVGYPIDGILDGHSVTGTPFAEGVIAMGIVGVPLFGLLAGVLTGFVFNRIAAAIARRRLVATVVWSNYAVACLFAWLNGGEIVQMFHLSVLVGALLCAVLASALVRAASPPSRPQHGNSPLPAS